MVDENKDTDLIPARKEFCVISDIDSDTKDRDLNLLRDKLSNALEKYLVNHPNERERFKRTQDGVNTITSVYAESLFEVSYVLGVKDPGLELKEITRDLPGKPFGTIDFAYVRKDEDGSFTVGINAHLFFDQAKEWDYSPVQRKVVKRAIHSTMAEEIAHIYLAMKYPQTDTRTNKANVENWNEYSKDRGENFTRAFAKRYLEYKDLT